MQLVGRSTMSRSMELDIPQGLVMLILWTCWYWYIYTMDISTLLMYCYYGFIDPLDILMIWTNVAVPHASITIAIDMLIQLINTIYIFLLWMPLICFWYIDTIYQYNLCINTLQYHMPPSQPCDGCCVKIVQFIGTHHYQVIIILHMYVYLFYDKTIYLIFQMDLNPLSLTFVFNVFCSLWSLPKPIQPKPHLASLTSEGLQYKFLN